MQRVEVVGGRDRSCLGTGIIACAAASKKEGIREGEHLYNRCERDLRQPAQAALPPHPTSYRDRSCLGTGIIACAAASKNEGIREGEHLKKLVSSQALSPQRRCWLASSSPRA